MPDDTAEGKTHATRALNELRRRILGGELVGGTRLYEAALAGTPAESRGGRGAGLAPQAGDGLPHRVQGGLRRPHLPALRRRRRDRAARRAEGPRRGSPPSAAPTRSVSTACARSTPRSTRAWTTAATSTSTATPRPTPTSTSSSPPSPAARCSRALDRAVLLAALRRALGVPARQAAIRDPASLALRRACPAPRHRRGDRRPRGHPRRAPGARARAARAGRHGVHPARAPRPALRGGAGDRLGERANDAAVGLPRLGRAALRQLPVIRAWSVRSPT